MDRTEIQDLGEFRLIAKLTEGLTKKQPSTLLGVGDDAAVVDPLGKEWWSSRPCYCEESLCITTR
ncbi:MAG: hypothetical protein CL825_00190 [Crocinitomicaceae bacterium]|nr:hypothetical protein [Crocinitomicaceae bacterium]